MTKLSSIQLIKFLKLIKLFSSSQSHWKLRRNSHSKSMPFFKIFYFISDSTFYYLFRFVIQIHFFTVEVNGRERRAKCLQKIDRKWEREEKIMQVSDSMWFFQHCIVLKSNYFQALSIFQCGIATCHCLEAENLNNNGKNLFVYDAHSFRLLFTVQLKRDRLHFAAFVQIISLDSAFARQGRSTTKLHLEQVRRLMIFRWKVNASQ